MSEPTTNNLGFIVPNTNDLMNAWGTAALNPNFNAIDGVLGGTVTISLGAATTFALSVTTAVLNPSSGPVQSQNACIFFTGTLTGNAVVQFTQPGRYIINNLCTGAGTFSIQLAPSAGVGNAIGAPPGRKQTVFYDGTNMDYVDLGPQVGGIEIINLITSVTTATRIPPWIRVCTVPPFIAVNDAFPGGTTSFNSATYPALFSVLGTTSLPQINPYLIFDANPTSILALIRAA
jgi:hypothetical protein